MKTGIYNFRYCIDIEIPSIPKDILMTSFIDRLNDLFDGSVIEKKFPWELLENAFLALEKYSDINRPIGKLAPNLQKHIWNAYAIANWDLKKLNSSVLTPNGYIRYKDEIGYIDFLNWEKPDAHERDYWGEPSYVRRIPTAEEFKQIYQAQYDKNGGPNYGFE